jgi:hypothetical protein
LSDISDITECPFPEILEDYATWKLAHIIGKMDVAKQYQAMYAGPDDETRTDSLTGLAKLRKHNDRIKREQGYGRSLVKFRGRQPNNYYSRYADTASRDYQRENFSD